MPHPYRITVQSLATDPPANHAEALSFDVTNQLSRPERHLKLAVGLDYLDACPVRGMRRGGGSEQMHARVYVSPHALQTQQ